MHSSSWTKLALLVLLAGIVSIIELNFVGDVTIYSLHYVTLRERSHEQIIRNQPPAGGWSSDGANATNVRIAVPYFVEFAHRQTGLRVGQLYKGVDLICTWLGFVAFFLFLRQWFTEWESLVGFLYLATALPLTFAFHSYQPWDRASFLAWLLAIWCANAKRFWTFCVIASAAALIKYDAVVLPILYFLGNVTRQNWRGLLLRSGGALILLLGIFFVLIVLIPGGFEPRHYATLIARNFGMMIRGLIFYPPFLAFGVPLMLAIVGYRTSGQFNRASVGFAGFVALILFVSTNFEEVRAEQMFFPLLVPSALFGLRRALNLAAPSGQPQTVTQN